LHSSRPVNSDVKCVHENGVVEVVGVFTFAITRCGWGTQYEHVGLEQMCVCVCVCPSLTYDLGLGELGLGKWEFGVC
jgi:hypothetical protein